MKILTRSSDFIWRKSRVTNNALIAKAKELSAEDSHLVNINLPSSASYSPTIKTGRSFSGRLSEHLSEIFAARKNKVIPPESFQNIRPLLSYLPSGQMRQVANAFHFAANAHSNQNRKDGTPYIAHPLATCKILAELKLDVSTLIAALLHDVVEDCAISSQEIADNFGDKVALIVTGVTKFKRLKGIDVNLEQAENFQKMIIAMASDLRVVLVKLADRLHNMRTLAVKSRRSQVRISRETMDIYAPIANRMGLNGIYCELQDLAFSYLYPYRSKVLHNALNSEFAKREENLFRLRDEVIASLKREGIRAEVSARMKNTYSIFCKMRDRQAKFAKVFDICGLRVVVKKNAQCYTCLGLIHELHKPIPGLIKDFIALPKNNGYQSLHSTLIGPGGIPVEVQIRSKVMHGVAESGLAAHWLYKDKTADLSDLEMRASQWMNSLKELNQTSANAGELLEHVKTELFSDMVYVFTPQGKIINLPRGATALDFAYSIHSEIGRHAKTAVINDEAAALRVELRNGDRISIDTSPMPTVTVASLSYTNTARARSQIRHYLRHLEQAHLRELGEHWLRQTLLEISTFEDDDLSTIPTAELEKKLQSAGLCKVGHCDSLFADIVLGSASPINIGLALLKKSDCSSPTFEKFVVHNADTPSVKFSTCCFPIPGDRIVGLLKKGEGLMVHRIECKHSQMHTSKKVALSLKKEPPMSQVPIVWSEKIAGTFVSRMTVVANNKYGLLAQISTLIAEQNCNIVGMQMLPTTEHITNFVLDVLVDNRVALGRLYKKLRSITKVKSILRWRE